MKKFILIISTIIIVLGLIIGTGIFLITKFTDPNDLKTKMTEVVYQKTGRELKVDGSVEWSFFPWIGVKVNNLVLSNTPKFKDKEFAKIDSCDIKLRTLPLVFGKIIIDKVTLNNLTLKLVRNNAGENNWRDLLGTLKKSETSTNAIPFLISDISINNANLSLEDQLNYQNIYFKDLTFSGKNINVSGTAFSITLKSGIRSQNPNISGNLEFTAKTTIDLKRNLYDLSIEEFKGNVLTSQMTQQVPFNFSADVVIDEAQQSLDVKNIKILFSSINAFGKVKATNIFYAPNVFGTLTASSFDPKPLLQAFGILPNNINPAATVFKDASFKVELQTTSKFLKIPTLNASLDSTVLTGQANYSHFGDKLVGLNLDINAIDLDPYFSLLMQQSQPEKDKKPIPNNNKIKTNKNNVLAASINHVASDNPIIEGLKLVKIDGYMHVKNLKFKKMTYSDVNSEINGDLGLIRLDPITFNWYDGKVNGNFEVNVRKPETQIAANINVAGAKTQPLFQDLINSNKVSGALSMTAALTSKGNNAETLLNNLRGKGNIKLNKGSFYGVDVRYQIDKANSLINKKSQTLKETNPPRTDFGQMTGNFAITNGAILTNNLLIQDDDFKVKGHGTVDLPKQTLNFLLEAYGKKTKFYVPIKLSGPLSNPAIAPDLSLFIGNIIQNKVTNELSKSGIKIETEDNNSKGTEIKSIKINKDKLNDLLHNI